MGVGFVTGTDPAGVRFVRRVHMGVLLPVGTVCESSSAAGKLADERSFSGVGPFVDLKVLGSGKQLAAAGERAWERLFSGMNADVVDKLVFCFEGQSITRTVLPLTDIQSVACVCCLYVLLREMVHNVLHHGELSSTRF